MKKYRSSIAVKNCIWRLQHDDANGICEKKGLCLPDIQTFCYEPLKVHTRSLSNGR